MKRLILVALAFAGPLAAQGSATVEGDIYLLMKSGDTKKGAGLSVDLIRVDKEWTTAIRGSCRSSVAEWDTLTVRVQGIEKDLAILRKQAAPEKWALDEVALRQRLVASGLAEIGPMFTRRIKLFADASIQSSARSGLAAHYRFAALRSGDYVLHAEWPVGDSTYEWWVPVTVKAGSRIVRDLDNDGEGSAFPKMCG